jgi:hypothetical protein
MTLKLCFFLLIISVRLFANAVEKVQYSFSSSTIDVVIPCCEKDLPTLDLCIDGVLSNIKGVERIIVVSNRKLTNKAEWFDETNYPFTSQDIENEILRGKKLPSSDCQDRYRLGWTFQQFLKLYAPFVIPNISRNVLIVDADTIFLSPVTFIGSSGGGFYNPGFEYQQPYFDHMKRVLPCLEKVFPEYSGISHHMLFQREVLEDLLSLIEKEHSVPAWKAICRSIDPEKGCGMSEYEIYFNFVFSRSDQMIIRKLLWKNIYTLRELVNCRNAGYHFVSYHDYMR